MLYTFFPPCSPPARMMIASDHLLYLPHPHEICLVQSALRWIAAHSRQEAQWLLRPQSLYGVEVQTWSWACVSPQWHKISPTNPICQMWMAIEITSCVRWTPPRLKGRSSAAAWWKWELSVLWQEDKRKELVDRYTGSSISQKSRNKLSFHSWRM